MDTEIRNCLQNVAHTKEYICMKEGYGFVQSLCTLRMNEVRKCIPVKEKEEYIIQRMQNLVNMFSKNSAETLADPVHKGRKTKTR